MNDEQTRKDFEEWMGDGGASPRAIGRNSMGDYILMQTAHAWEVWKAAHTHYAKSATGVLVMDVRCEGCGYMTHHREHMGCVRAAKQRAQPQADALDAERALLTVRLTSFPESNGKRNWTAQFVRAKPWEGLVGSAGGITIAYGEHWNRVAYEAERARFLIGERDTEPYIRDYGTDIQTPDEWLGEGKERAAIAAAMAKP